MAENAFKIAAVPCGDPLSGKIVSLDFTHKRTSLQKFNVGCYVIVRYGEADGGGAPLVIQVTVSGNVPENHSGRAQFLTSAEPYLVQNRTRCARLE